jgi:hypothetical protein
MGIAGPDPAIQVRVHDHSKDGCPDLVRAAQEEQDTVAARARPATAAALYDADFYAWTQEQAAALRTHFRGDNRIDVEHLAEEIADLGKSGLQAVESYVVQIIAHLLKLHYSGFDLPRRHWRQEVLAFRQSVRRKMGPSVGRIVRENLDQLYQDARQLAAASLDAEPDLEDRLPKTNPYDWDDITVRPPTPEAASGDVSVTRRSRRRKRGA